jgi:predicted Zn-dependent protease
VRIQHALLWSGTHTEEGISGPARRAIDDHLVIVIVRAAAALLALVVCAWFAIGIRQSVDTNRASALIGGGTRLTAPQVRRARSQLSSAAFLNPDLTIELLRGQLALDQGRKAAAERAIESVTRREPLNLIAWVKLIVAATETHDKPAVVTAARHASQLYVKPR